MKNSSHLLAQHGELLQVSAVITGEPLNNKEGRFLKAIGELQDLRRRVGKVLLTEDRNPSQQLPAGEPLLDALVDCRVEMGQTFDGHRIWGDAVDRGGVHFISVCGDHPGHRRGGNW